VQFLVETLERDETKAVIARTYIIDGQTNTSSTAAKIAGAMASLRGRPASGAFMVTMECDGDCVSARLRVSEFARSALPVVIERLDVE